MAKYVIRFEILNVSRRAEYKSGLDETGIANFSAFKLLGYSKIVGGWCNLNIAKFLADILKQATKRALEKH